MVIEYHSLPLLEHCAKVSEVQASEESVGPDFASSSTSKGGQPENI